ncbi:MAG: hypothetical protein RLY71_3457 [Pseudomonadota bacterium]|jgi:diguanylate cyclase (GGDEF)-like protein
MPSPTAELMLPLLERASCPAALYDPDDRLHWANPAFLTMFGATLDGRPSWAELIRAGISQGVGTRIETDDLDAWLQSTGSRRGKAPYRQFEVDLTDGRWILMTETVDSQGWMLCIAVDVTDMGCDHRALRIARDLAQRAALVDGLTGIGNRSFVLGQLGEALLSSRGRPWVALLDLDHFKSINDRFGHAAGDAVLKHFAGLLQEQLRRADACGRIGGEEFLIVLHGVDQAGAQEALQRLLTQVRAARPAITEHDLSYTFSAGLTRAHPGERPEEVMARADRALYEAKRAGRNRCVTLLD